MAFEYVGSGSPVGQFPSGGAASPASYVDKLNGVVYMQTAQGWQIPLVSAQDNMTAKAGGGQAGATAITAWISRFTTVATIADSAILPSAIPGMTITVSNAATNSMNVFPASGEIINALGANAAFAVAGGKTCEFFCAKAGQWHTVLSA